MTVKEETKSTTSGKTELKHRIDVKKERKTALQVQRHGRREELMMDEGQTQARKTEFQNGQKNIGNAFRMTLDSQHMIVLNERVETFLVTS